MRKQITFALIFYNHALTNIKETYHGKQKFIHEIHEEIKNSDNNLKYEAMTIFEELIQEGIDKGIDKANKATIIRSWQNGIAIPMIANITGLPISVVEQVIAEFKAKS